MLKNILIKCAELLNRDDLVSALKDASTTDDIINSSQQNDVTKLISYYNFTLSNICENYLYITTTDTLCSDSENRIYYNSFYYTPVKIIQVFDGFYTKLPYQENSTYLYTSSPNKHYYITYAYHPPELKELNDNVYLPRLLAVKTLCYGIISEFLASKGQLVESEFWQNKFMYEIFKTKLNKERRLKATFYR